MASRVLVSIAGTLRYDERPGHRRECFGYSHFRLNPQFSRQEAIADTVNQKAALAIDASDYGDLSEANAYFAMRLHETAWTDANPTDRPKALWAATQIIDTLA